MPKEKTNPNKAETKGRSSLYVGSDVLRSIKFIAFTEERPQTQVMDQALTEFIERWEKKNGPIPKKG